MIQKKDKERIDDILVAEVKDAFNTSSKNYDLLDNKIYFCITLCAALFGLFIQFIDVPTNPFLIYLYLTSIILFLFVLSTLVLQFSPKEYYVYGYNNAYKRTKENKYSNYDCFKEEYIGEINNNIEYLKKLNRGKGKIISRSYFLIFIILIITLIIKIASAQ